MGLASLFGDIFTANANKGVAKDMAARNEALMREFFGVAEKALTPYMDRGNQAGGMYMDALLGGDKARSAFETYKNSAGYQTNLESGIDAINTGKSNQGLLKSGSTLKSALRFGTDLNQNYFDSWIGKLGLPQQIGGAAAGSLATGAFNFAGMGTQNNNNLASGLINANNSMNNGFQNYLNDVGQGLAYGGFGG